MGSRWMAFTVAVVATLALLPVTGGEARKKTCKVRGDDTHLQTKDVRVFTTGADKLTYYVCYRKTGKKTKIGRQTGPEQLYTWKPAGRFLPYVNSLPDRWVVRLRDAKSGALKFDFTILFKDGEHGSSLATPSGGLAFILSEVVPATDLEEESRFLALYGHKAGTGQHAYTKLSTEQVKDMKRDGDVVSWVTTSGTPGSADLGP